jgi:hypothetical protein
MRLTGRRQVNIEQKISISIQGCEECTRVAHSTAKLIVMLSTPARAAPVCLQVSFEHKLNIDILTGTYIIPGKPLNMSAMMFTMTPPF